MTAETEYSSWAAISSAIKATAAKNARAGGPDVASQLEIVRFDRFLSRVFADRENSAWLLKGGTSILARVERSRATHDVDLASAADSLDKAAEALRECAGRDLGDHLRFELTRTRHTGGDNQPGVETRRMVFTCYDIATNRKVGDVPVDVVIGHAPVGPVEIVEPVNRLTLPRPLTVHPYRLFPVVDQVADKVCATLATNYPGGKHSSRVKDLVDLVVLARTQRMDLDQLRVAIATKQALSQLPPIQEFSIPESWFAEYPRLATRTPATGGLVDANEAQAYVAELIGPAIGPITSGPATWVPGTGWTALDDIDSETVHEVPF